MIIKFEMLNAGWSQNFVEQPLSDMSMGTKIILWRLYNKIRTRSCGGPQDRGFHSMKLKPPMP